MPYGSYLLNYIIFFIKRKKKNGWFNEFSGRVILTRLKTKKHISIIKLYFYVISFYFILIVSLSCVFDFFLTGKIS